MPVDLALLGKHRAARYRDRSPTGRCLRAPVKAAPSRAASANRADDVVVARRWLLPTDTRDFGQLFDPRLTLASFHPHAAHDPAFCIPRSASKRARLADAPRPRGGRARCDEGFLRKRWRRRAE